MTTVNVHRETFTKDFRRQHSVPHTIHLAFEECIIKVTANHADIIAELQAYAKPFITEDHPPHIHITVIDAQPPKIPHPYTPKPLEPGKSKIKEEFIQLINGRIVRKRLTDMLFIFGGEENLAIGPCRQNMNQVVNFINHRYIEWLLCQEGLLGHAAGVVKNGKGLAIAGFSGAGKSTLALQLMRHDMKFVSNDRLILRKDKDELIMHGVAKLPRINPGTALNNPNLANILSKTEKNEFSALPRDALWQLEYKYDVPIDTCFGTNRFILSEKMVGLVILNWRRNNGPFQAQKIDLRQRRDLLPAFIKETGLFFIPDSSCSLVEPTEENYIALLSVCQVWELAGSIDFDAAVQSCLKLLQSDTRL